MASKAADWLLARHAAADAEVAEDIAAGLRDSRTDEGRAVS
jgi:hypothetical protein